jgi:F-type H+-transporting ATPase subunit b
MLFAAAAGVDLPLWQGIAWAIFAALLVYFAGPPLMAALRARERGIVEVLAKAEIAQRELADLRAKNEAELARVRAEAAEMLAEGRRDAAVLRQELVEQAKREIVHLRARTSREISQAELTARVELFRAAADRAFEVAQRALANELRDDDHRRLLDRSMASLERTFAAGGV